MSFIFNCYLKWKALKFHTRFQNNKYMTSQAVELDWMVLNRGLLLHIPSIHLLFFHSVLPNFLQLFICSFIHPVIHPFTRTFFSSILSSMHHPSTYLSIHHPSSIIHHLVIYPSINLSQSVYPSIHPSPLPIIRSSSSIHSFIQTTKEFRPSIYPTPIYPSSINPSIDTSNQPSNYLT